MGQCCHIRAFCCHIVKISVAILLPQFPLKHSLFVRFAHFSRGGQKPIANRGYISNGQTFLAHIGCIPVSGMLGSLDWEKANEEDTTNNCHVYGYEYLGY
jgi:hypothetical protein